MFDEERFYDLLWSTLEYFVPVDTRNLQNHIEVNFFTDYIQLIVSGPKKDGTDYASYVNEKQTPTARPKNRGKINYKFVERSVEQALNLYGEVLIYELS